jgi:hypothetical protein
MIRQLSGAARTTTGHSPKLRDGVGRQPSWEDHSMTGERTVPLLPCASIDDIRDFYMALGFEQTYRQLRPNPHIVLERDDIGLHFFGMPDFVPDNSYGSCLVVVPDIGGLYSAFAAGLRERYGKLPIAGIPRITRPRARKNADGMTGFSVVDPGGNWIRFYEQSGPSTDPDGETAQPASADLSKLADAIANAVVLGDSKGDAAQAAKILDGALRKFGPAATVTDRRAALIYRAELAIRLSDRSAALAALDEAQLLGDPAAQIAELRQSLD